MDFTWMKLLYILRDSFLGSSGPIRIVASVLYMAGVWRLLEKSDLKGWWALIPCAREYQLSRCAGREPEGRVASLANFGYLFFNALSFLISEAYPVAFYSSVVLTLTLRIVLFLYLLRIYGGLIEVYGKRKRWMWRR